MRKLLVFLAAFSVAPLWAGSASILIQSHTVGTAAAGGGGGGNLTFASTGTYLNTTGGTTLKFGFPAVPSTGDTVALGICFSGTTLPSSVLNNSSGALTKSTSTTNATGSIGCAQYYEQSITVTGATYTVTVTFAGSTAFGGNMIRSTGQSNPTVDVSTGVKPAAIIADATTPTTASDCKLIIGNYASNATNANQVITIPAGWTNMGQFNDGNAGLANFMAYKTGAGLNSTNISGQFQIQDSGNQSVVDMTTFH